MLGGVGGTILKTKAIFMADPGSSEFAALDVGDFVQSHDDQ